MTCAANAPVLDNLEAPYRARLSGWPLGVTCTWADLQGEVTVGPGWGDTIQAGVALALISAGGVAAHAASRVTSTETS